MNKTIYQIKDNDTLGRCIRHIGNLHPDKTWTITIEKKGISRSTQQNALYWKWLSIMGDHFGYTKDEMHEELAARFLGIVERKTIGGHKIMEPRSTATLKTKEFSDYMDMIHALAVQQDIRLPKPQEYGYQE
jgi:hypothetical protein